MCNNINDNVNFDYYIFYCYKFFKKLLQKEEQKTFYIQKC